LIIWLLKKYLFWVENTSNPDYSHIEKNWMKYSQYVNWMGENSQWENVAGIDGKSW
jgi:hypothetical protein